MKLGTMETDVIYNPKRRVSYFNKLIEDQDIPLEDLHSLPLNNHQRSNGGMAVYGHMKPTNHLENTSDEFFSDAYLEYRRKVFDQLAAEYEKDQKRESFPEVQQQFTTDSSHTQNINEAPENTEELIKLSPEFPTWDDSDLKSDAYISPQVLSDNQSNTLPWHKNNHKNGLYPDNHSQSVLELSSNDNHNSFDWSSYDAHIEKVSKAVSNDSVKTDSSENVSLITSPRAWRGNRNSFKKQKMDREVIRQKLSMADSDEEDVNFLYQSRFQRSYSANNQSLQICYINESCSSDDNSDEEEDRKKEDSPSSPSFSPRTGYGSGYLRRSRISDTSSHSSHSSHSSSSVKNESNVVRTNHQDLRSGRSRQQEMELEARIQLAQAHQRAKLEAANGRKMKKNTSSLAHRLLSNTLDDETTRKIKTYSLCKSDCRRMTLGQLQLILNDMHAQKQALNDDLVYLLMERDDLRMEQDGKLTEVDDAKAIMSDVGPETTV